jgi:hypothetical protein
MANKWLAHIKKTMKQMKAKGTYAKGKGLGQVIKAAKLTWHKAKKGGGGDDDDGVQAGNEMKDVDLKSDPPAAAAAATTPDPDDPAQALGGRRRKTRRRRHSRRR